MFPLHDDNPTLAPPLVTWSLIALNLLVWLLVQGMGNDPRLGASICHLGLIPAEFLGLSPAGATVQLTDQVVCRLDTTVAWFTPLSSMFLHGSWMHIIGNLWFLWVFGNNVEDSMGHLRFVVFYLVCGLAAAAAQVASHPAGTVPMVGASGAIGGVMGAYAVLYPRAHVYMLLFLGFYVRTIAVPAIFMLGYWFVIQIISGIPALASEGGGTAFWAHVGGFVAGMVLIFVFRNRAMVEAHRRASRRGVGRLQW